jgi:hypothetical protein
MGKVTRFRMGFFTRGACLADWHGTTPHRKARPNFGGHRPAAKELRLLELHHGADHLSWDADTRHY